MPPSRSTLWFSLTLSLACSGGGLTLDGGGDAPVAPGDMAAPVENDAAPADRPLPVFEALPVLSADATPQLDSAPDTRTPPDAGPPAPDLAPDRAHLPPDTAPLPRDAAPDLPRDAEPDGPPATLIFADDFESGGTAKWTSGAGSRMVTAGCAASGSHGLRLEANAGSRIWFDFPAPRRRVSVRARIDYSQYVPSSSTGIRPLLTVSVPNIYRIADMGYSPGSVSSKIHGTLWRPGSSSRQIHHDRELTPAPHLWQLDWGGSQPNMADGFLGIWVDGLAGRFEPATATQEMTINPTVSRVTIGFFLADGSGFICVDDVEVFELP